MGILISHQKPVFKTGFFIKGKSHFTGLNKQSNYPQMKKTSILTLLLLLFVNVLSAQDKTLADSTYKDGTYEGMSRAKYTYEPYWGIIHLTIKNGIIGDISFSIRDSALHEYFDGKYEKHFEGNEVYINQSRNDWKGVQAYPELLAEKQDPNKIDAISGATWSYNIFKASLREALKNPKKP
jgi:major membrane immunogen (membrane-anchored lipoprotein)